MSRVPLPAAPKKPSESLGLMKDFAASDLVIECRLTFASTAEGGAVWHAQEKDGVVYGMHALVIGAGGADLWRLQGRTWTLLTRNVVPLEAGYPYALRVVVRGDKMTVALDDEILLEGRDQFLMEKGAAGLYARNGECRFEALQIQSLDPKEN